jgi:hypothetical protein
MQGSGFKPKKCVEIPALFFLAMQATSLALISFHTGLPLFAAISFLILPFNQLTGSFANYVTGF